MLNSLSEAFFTKNRAELPAGNFASPMRRRIGICNPKSAEKTRLSTLGAVSMSTRPRHCGINVIVVANAMFGALRENVARLRSPHSAERLSG
jgi:hypothetical protein